MQATVKKIYSTPAKISTLNKNNLWLSSQEVHRTLTYSSQGGKTDTKILTQIPVFCVNFQIFWLPFCAFREKANTIFAACTW